MATIFYCPHCGHPLDMYTQRVKTKTYGTLSVDFGTCRQDDCALVGMTLSIQTWRTFTTDTAVSEKYGAKVNFDPMTGERWEP